MPNTGISASCQSGYGTIGAAVTAAAAGDTILVGPGTYAEVVSIPTALTGLSLLGSQAGVDPRLGTRVNAAAESVIDASSLTDSALIVQATNVVIDGFTVQGGIAGSANGIDLKGNGSGFAPADGARVLNNIIQNNSVGLALNGEGFGTVNDVVIQHNLFRTNNAGTPSQAGDGIFSSACQNVVIDDNTFTGNKRLGIGINNATGITISNNLGDGEGRFVVFTGVSHSSVVRNTGTNLVNTGTFVATARASYILLGYNNSYVTVSDNTLTGGEAGSAIRGIQLGGYGPAPVNTNITVSNNTIRSMPLHGIVAEQGLLTNSTIAGNHVSSSGTDGIFIDSGNSGNAVSRNISMINGGMDFRDSSSGSGTAGTADVWLMNIGPARTPAGICQSRAGGDLNADLKSDVIWRKSTTGENAVWLMNGVNISQNALLPTLSDLNWKVGGTGDFDGDGQFDVLWVNTSTGQVVIWLMNGTTIATGRTVTTLKSTNWHIGGIGDFDGDRRSDVVWRNVATGEVVMWLMHGTQISSAANLPTINDLNWSIAGVGDFNGDGMADIFWRNSSNGNDAIWQMNGTTMTPVATGAVPSLNWQVAGIGDADGDGRSDVLWWNQVTGDTAVWLMNGGAISSAAVLGTVSDLNWHVEGIGDFDGDGRVDLLWRKVTTGETVMWLLNGLAIKQASFATQLNDANWTVAAPR